MKKATPKKSTLTQTDVSTLINKMKVVFPTRVEMQKTIKLEIDTAEERLNESIRLLPTKEEFFSRMDKLSGEVLAMRQEFTLHTGQHEEITDRFERVDKHLGVSTAI